MSLINQALQDLEHRQGGALAGDPLVAGVRLTPMPPARRRGPGFALVLAAAAASAAGWWALHRAPEADRAPALAALPPHAVAATQVAALAPSPSPSLSPSPAHAPAAVPAPAHGDVVAQPRRAADIGAARHEAAAMRASESKPSHAPRSPEPEVRAAAATPAPAVKGGAVVAVVATPATTTPAPQARTRAPEPPPVPTVRAEGLVKTPTSAGPDAGERTLAAADTADLRLEKTVGPQQLSQNLYRRAALLVNQGNSIDARPLLRRALAADASNAQARQMLASLLVEGNELADASALLQDGVRITPERSALWMALARLQLEQGDTARALATLEQGLPSAQDDAPYHGFYATLLQRAGRNDEAVREYLLALRQDASMPNWLVGIGISLQAIGRSQEAADAYTRARDGGRLTGPMLAFVSQRIEQLRH